MLGFCISRMSFPVAIAIYNRPIQRNWIILQSVCSACLQAFLPMWFNRFTAQPNPGNTYTLGGMSDSYYEYLLKVWLLKGKQVCKSDSMSKFTERLLPAIRFKIIACPF